MSTSVFECEAVSGGCSIRELRLDLDGNYDHWRNNQAMVATLSTVTATDELLLALELPRRPITSTGNGLVLPVRGLCIHRDLPVVGMTVSLGTSTSRLRCREARDEVAQTLTELDFANARNCGFSGQLAITAEQGERIAGQHLAFEIRLSNGERVDHTGALPILEPVRQLAHGALVESVNDSSGDDITPPWQDDRGPRVFIAMATYNPRTEAFERQLESIRTQSHENWHLLINDDCSDAEIVERIVACIGSDARISFRQNKNNQGFYYNFETALSRAPASTEYVALSDQDDFWYPDKLERLVHSMQTGVMLSYCDMRVRNTDGSVISDTYWRGRRNNYQDLDVLLLANTVTGAASLFRHELLATLLPFPARIGDAFHDHWIACAALAQGKLGYVDAPLYDYVQHDDAVVGHCDFETPSPRARLARLKDMIFRSRGPGSLRDKVLHARQSALAVFRFECRRIELICSNLLLRCPSLADDKARALALYGHGSSSGIRLMLKHLAVIRRGHSTNDAEIRLGTGYLVDAIEHARHRIRYAVQSIRRSSLDRFNSIINSTGRDRNAK